MEPWRGSHICGTPNNQSRLSPDKRWLSWRFAGTTAASTGMRYTQGRGIHGVHRVLGTSIRSASEFALMHRRSIFRAGSLQADLTGRNSRPTIDSPSLSLLKWSDRTFIFNRPTSASSTITSEQTEI